jgi:hypothetical protein
MLARFDPDSRLYRSAFFGWAVLIGTRNAPGLVQWVRFLPSEGKVASAKLRAALAGRFKAWQTINSLRTA